LLEQSRPWCASTVISIHVSLSTAGSKAADTSSADLAKAYWKELGRFMEIRPIHEIPLILEK
jgi:hypothetical protein